jgi:glycosyltransferase involved in cell wall biosynthesis
VAFIYGGVNGERLAEGRCTLHRVAAATKYDAVLPARLLRLVRRVQPDVIHTWLTHMDILGGVVAHLLRKPWVMSERSAALAYRRTLLNWSRVATGRHAHGIMANSPGGAEYWREHGVEASRIVVVPNFVASDEIERATTVGGPDVGPDDEVVLYVGRLSHEKNLPTLIEAMDGVVRRRPRARLVLCGEGPLRRRLIAQTRSARLDRRVVFAGFVACVAPWLKRASIVVAVSAFEGHPNAVLEAVAAGVPVIVSDIPAHRSILDEDSASFVSVGGSHALTAAILEDLEHPNAAAQRAERARRHVAWPSLASTSMRYEDVYRRAIEIASR